jgi:UDP-N-acetylglucosamine--N-acetylmuramyl-(pentapeptide) pyrophosphoryl-undecaprenol N-acetylglucosamine transferase
LYPGIALAREIKRRAPDTDIAFVGTASGVEARVVPREGFPLDLIRMAGVKGKSRVEGLKGLALVPVATLDAWGIVSRRRPDVVVGVGGFASGPVLLVAALRGRPTILLEQNALPGLTNRLLARVVRAAAVDSPRQAARILIFGGSQGAHAINVAMVEAASRLAASNAAVEITHQTGKRDLDLVRDAYERAGVEARVEAFLFEMDREMMQADLVICRAGATTLAELAAAGRPAVLVPLATATDDHQRKNAEVIARAGGAEVIEERDLSGAHLADRLLALVADGDRRRRMAEAIRTLARPDAAARIADRVWELAGQVR